MPAGVLPLPVHEVESLLALPAVVRGVAAHLTRGFSESAYLDSLKATVNEDQARTVIIQRWKVAIEPSLAALMASTSKTVGSLDDLEAQLPELFDMRKWSFSPHDMLQAERRRVETALTSTSVADFLAIVPGKQLVPVAARTVGMEVGSYVGLVTETLHRTDEVSSATLRHALVEAFQSRLPARAAAIAMPSVEAPPA